MSYKIYKQHFEKKKTIFLKRKFNQLIVADFVSYFYIHNDDAKAQMLAGCQEMIFCSFC